ncbi:MAG TPA: FkbM family methyltransferase [Ruminiclostridium sp.]|nr:FkbM family methyltransferase [Ruminiclostridium sp.]
MVNEFSVEKFTKLLDNNAISLLAKLKSNDRPIVIFGAGRFGLTVFECLTCAGYTADYFCDNNPKMHGRMILGRRVLNFDELKNEHKDSLILISTPGYCEEIKIQLDENGFRNAIIAGGVNDAYGAFEVSGLFYQSMLLNKRLFEETFDSLSDELSEHLFEDFISFWMTGNPKYLIPLISKDVQYFAPDIIKLSDTEVFVDGGAWFGDTVDDFIKATKGQYRAVYSFEPDRKNIDSYLKRHSGKKNIDLIPMGLWGKKETLNLLPDFSDHSGNRLSDQSAGPDTYDVSVTSIDSELDGREVTFIKLDIEGSELEALKGAEKTIKNFKPKLAVCVYHKPLDIVRIPMYLKSLVPEYNFSLRHYNDKFAEKKDNHTGTVLYATIN